uniref:Uncharacterized protein n=1 Tax=Amphiprion percula TaxID=161767 RepID=A0A3P8SE15_AMPPE
MDLLRTGVFVFFVLPAPGSCLAFSTFSHPVICYFLDAFLLVYCIVATALFFKEKVSSHLFRELERPTDPDPYQVLEPSKRKVFTCSGT